MALVHDQEGNKYKDDILEVEVDRRKTRKKRGEKTEERAERREGKKIGQMGEGRGKREIKSRKKTE